MQKYLLKKFLVTKVSKKGPILKPKNNFTSIHFFISNQKSMSRVQFSFIQMSRKNPIKKKFTLHKKISLVVVVVVVVGVAEKITAEKRI